MIGKSKKYSNIAKRRNKSAFFVFYVSKSTLFAVTTGKTFGFSLAFFAVSVASAKHKKNNGNKRSATANFFDYIVYASVFAAAKYKHNDKQPKIAVVVKTQTVHNKSPLIIQRYASIYITLKK